MNTNYRQSSWFVFGHALAIAALVLVAAAPVARASDQLNLNALDAKTNKATTPDSASGCQEDPRLSQIGQFLQQIDSTHPPESPLQIPAAQLLKFNPVILGKLNGHYVVISSDCKPISVIDGVFVQKVSVSFAPLANAVADAARTGNQDRMNFLAQNFQAAPVDPMAGLSLIAIAPYPKPLQDSIAKMLTISEREISTGNSRVKNLIMADFYVRLGGQIMKPLILQLNTSGTLTIENDPEGDAYTVRSGSGQYYSLGFYFYNISELRPILVSMGYQIQ